MKGKGLIMPFKKLVRLFLKSYSESKITPYSDLDYLIQRAKERMRIKPVCPFCSNEILFRHSTIAGGNLIPRTPKGSPIRDDQYWKCPNCFHTSHFGLPMSRRDALIEMKLRGGSDLLYPTCRSDEREREDVKKRLRALGYLDF